MKKLLVFACLFSAFLFSNCGNSNSNTVKEAEDSIHVGVEEVIGNENLNVDSLKQSISERIKSWGAKDAYFDEDGYFVYCVDPSEISASGYEVAKAMFPTVEEVPNVKGCIVRDYKSKDELGRYDR